MTPRHATRLFLLLLFLFALSSAEVSAQDYFPAETWEEVSSLEAEGWSPEALQEARVYADSIGSAAVMVVHRGRIVDEWGELERKFMCHSIRKSFLSALYGIYVQQGDIDLQATMGELGIDDHESLNEQERQATVRMLLQARSGIYHPALYETAAMAAARPERHSHEPGTFWYYNNWDFNAAGTIFEQESGEPIHQAFKDRIADPIGMQAYEVDDGRYVDGDDSIHDAYPFLMNARDMARFGLLFLRNGQWEGERVVPEFWIKESTASYSDAGDAGGYGYMWWVSVDQQHFGDEPQVPFGTYTARGAGGHTLAIIPDLDLVFVHRVDTFDNDRVAYADAARLLMKIIAARDNWEGSPNY